MSSNPAKCQKGTDWYDWWDQGLSTIVYLCEECLTKAQNEGKVW